MSHTPEPWSVAEESFDNDGIHESVIRGLDGRAAIAVTLEFGANNPGMREANARRIVACVNACATMPTDDLEEMVSVGGNIRNLAEFADELRKQRDALLAALTEIAELDILKHHHAYAIAKGAIEEIEALK